MPSFDVVSEIDKPELSNALHQANKELGTRFDFKGTDARVELSESTMTVFADNEFQVKQAVEVLCLKLAARGIDLACLDYQRIEEIGGGKAKQIILLKEGINSDLGRKLVKQIKDKKLKVQTAIQGDQLRITGKKRDDLQTVIAFLREADAGIPLQFNNFRD
ncbi:YajQ family cyclic di-GMP-binding protein [Arenicella xantha]|uniref:Nucleotide-binding protein DFR28_104205 n=1 Tax=Arenicella xantha TaxID=644221 RepID=A0A395JH44_9GAMM|nr:YajQ family cyclic di-GMP-binding protein [Arenicella xantha]RBP49277.1 hypothetical protein DFR28_104205 [Arenicella xantha]